MSGVLILFLLVAIVIFIIGLSFVWTAEHNGHKGIGFMALAISAGLFVALGFFLGKDHYQDHLTQVISKTEVPIAGEKSFEVSYIVTYIDGELKHNGSSIQAVPGSARSLSWTPMVK